MSDLSPHGSPLPTAVRWSHEILGPRLRPGDFAVDGTAGNGHDTLFLAQRILPGGGVYAFDLQLQAVESTRARLNAADVQIDDGSDVRVIQASHGAFENFLPPAWWGHVRAFMFNLGFLPGGDKSVITETGSTLSALARACEWLAEDGVMTVVAYPGHEGGRQEAEAVQQWLAALPSDRYEVQRIGFLNFRPTTPFLLVTRKRTTVPD